MLGPVSFLPFPCHFTVVCEGATGSVHSKKLFKKFFEEEGYNRNVRPVMSVDTVTQVHMLLYVAQVLEMVHSAQLFEFKLKSSKY